MSVLDGVTWNPHIGRADELRELVARLVVMADTPAIVTLEEVWDWHGTIPGYRRVAADPRRFPHREARSTIHLVRRKGVRLWSHGARQVDGPEWIGPVHGKVHPPRVYPRATIRVDRQRWDVVGVHRTPGGPDAHREANRRSWRAEHDALVEWSDDRAQARPFLLVGDHQAAPDRHPFGHEALARDIGGEAKLRGPDGVIGRSCQLRHVERLAALGSDHHAVRWEAHA